MSSQNYLVKDLIKSKMMLIPGHKAELYCLAAEEARELCLPIVTLGMGSLKERVEHEKTGFVAKNYSEFAEYTLALFKNENLYRNILKNLIEFLYKLICALIMARVWIGLNSIINLRPAIPSKSNREKMTNKNLSFGTFLTTFSRLFLKFKNVL